MVKIRLSRHGSKGKIFYRIVAVDEKRKRSGITLEVLGYWHPGKSEKKIDKKKLEAWIAKGAKTTKGVEKIIS